jgi:2-methylcitrate dehydratase PrpD
MSSTTDATAAEHEAALGAFVADLSLEDIPDEIRERATLVVADTLGAVLGGASDEAVAALTAEWGLATNGGGTASVFGTPGTRTTRERAAFLNATAGTVLELDEGHRFAGGHPAIHVLPALWADGEGSFRSGERFLVAFVAGYEAAVRVARAVGPLTEGYHPHGVWGAVGAAAGTARLRGDDAATTTAALRIAANYAQHTRFAAATEGATVRNAYTGMANLGGLVAADQAAAGFSGVRGGVCRHLEPAAGDGVDPTALSAALGDRWELGHGYFKRHAACRYTHPVLDAVSALQAAHGFGRNEVESVRVETYPAAAALDTTDPENPLQAKFSVPFAVATTVVTGTTGKEAFGADALTHEALALAERVVVETDDELAARVPDERGARVTVSLTDGEQVAHEVRAARGGEHDPFTEAELHEKFDALVVPVVGEERAARLWDAAREPAAPRVLATLTGA